MYKVLSDSSNLLVTWKGISTGSSFLQVVQLKVTKSLTCWVLKWGWLNILYLEQNRSHKLSGNLASLNSSLMLIRT